MVYPVSIYRLVIGGTIYSETWNTSLQIYPTATAPIDEDLLEDVAEVVRLWYTDGDADGGQFHSQAPLTYIKLNRIDVNGHYQDPVSMTYDYPTPQPGTGAGTGVAPQIAIVATLKTNFERGLAHRGRMYLPPATGFINPGVDGRATAASAQRIAGSVSTLINGVNAAFASWTGGPVGGRVAVISNKGAGAWHLVTSVEVGRVLDTMRSRRSSLDEDYQPSLITITGPGG